MPKLLVTGDKHGEIEMDELSSASFPEGARLCRDDILVIAGDFGLCFAPRQVRSEQWWLNWLDKKPWTTVFVDGNHENFPRLDSLPVKEMFGGPVGVAAPNVFHLRRGYVYELAGQKCFVMGGAASVDRHARIPGVSWWPEEIPSSAEMDRGMKNLDAAGWEVDAVITHAAPVRMIRPLLERTMFEIPLNKGRLKGFLARMYEDIHFRDPCSEYLEEIAKRIRFRKWFFGHYHLDASFDGGFEALYYSVMIGDGKDWAFLKNTPGWGSAGDRARRDGGVRYY